MGRRSDLYYGLSYCCGIDNLRAKACTAFSSHGIALSVIKPPVSLGHGSCSYALRIKEADLQKAAALLSGISIKIKGIYVVENGKYREAEI